VAGRFRGKEGLKDAVADLGIDTDTGIGNGQC
jgi:hypothetical protein